MEQPAQSAPSAAATTFAGMLASLATPAPKRAPAWNDDDLADDVATLSYERALRTHSRYRSSELNDRSLTQIPDPEPMHFQAAYADATPSAAPTATRQTASTMKAEPAVARESSTALDRNLKRSSITIRLSTTECEQLHKRAAEAGLSVSAYLRSCTFEAESLRALVKDTLAQLQAAQTTEKQKPSPQARHSWFGWLPKLFPRGQASQRTVQA
ncbi:MAG: hypothetical protein P4K94_06475 [Terracidiphilus sp.]|nr:hypothetical protein [Terracidiphilus sp.]